MIQPASTTQFCKEAGYDFPQLVSQYSTSSSCRAWNGTSWYEDPACVAANELKCCNLVTTPTPPSSCRNFTYPTNKANYTYDSATGYISGNATGAIQFCTAKGYTSGTLITAGNLG